MGKDSKEARKRICKHIKRNLIFSGKEYLAKRRFIKDVEGEVIGVHIPGKIELS